MCGAALQRGQNPTLARCVTKVSLPVCPMSPEMLADPRPKNMFVRTTHPRGNLARPVGVNGVPQLSVGSSNRRQTHLLVGGQKRNGFARRGQTDARQGVGHGHQGMLSKLPTRLRPQAKSHSEFMAISADWAPLQGSNFKIATAKRRDTFAQFG